MTKNVRSSNSATISRGELTKERILLAAGRLIGSIGFRRTTITAIAEAAGIGKATVYLYFKDKEDILATLVNLEVMNVLEQIQEAVDAEQTVVDQLRAYILMRYRSVHSLLAIYNATSRVLLEDVECIRQASAQFSNQELDLVQSILERGKAAGELGLTDTRLAAIAVTGTLRSLDQPWIFQKLPLDLEKRVDDVVHLFLYGLNARKDAA